MEQLIPYGCVSREMNGNVTTANGYCNATSIGTAPIVEGYTPLYVVPSYSGNNRYAVITNCQINSNKEVLVALANVNGATSGTYTVRVKVVYTRE